MWQASVAPDLGNRGAPPHLVRFGSLADARARIGNYHQPKGLTFADWDAAFRNWMLNAKKFAAKSSDATATYKPRGPVRTWAEIQAERRTKNGGPS